MLELIAQGPESDMRWRRPLPEGIELVIGRQAEPWPVSWDPRVSRRHFRAVRIGDRLTVTRLPDASNPVFYRGDEADDFQVAAGEHFVVGDTTFSLTAGNAFPTLEVADPVHQRSYSPDFLRQLRYRDADQRIRILGQLPEVIASATNESELFDRVTHLLLAGIRAANQVAVVFSDGQRTGVLHWDDRRRSFPSSAVADFQPSQRLIQAAIGEETSMLHLWEGSPSEADYTMLANADWAFVVPLTGEAGREKGIYVAGRRSDVDDEPESGLEREIKFTELIATTLSAVLQAGRLQRRQASLRSFFAPEVLAFLSSQDSTTALAPRECDVSVLFSDLKGFAGASEQQEGNLIGWLDQVSRQMGVVTRAIREREGVIGDFHGDAVMGFWGWPVPRPESAVAAVEGALAISQAMSAHAIGADFPAPLGIGIATGRAVCGMIGTEDQVKVTAFGPVVNLASRLEGLTRTFRARILLDGATAAAFPAIGRWERQLRRLGRVRPKGLTAAYDVFELALEPWSADSLARWEEGRCAFESGRWEAARGALRQLPTTDAAAAFLLQQIESVGKPPAEWEGVIEFGGRE